MPSLTPASEATETLTGVRDVGFYPGTFLYREPFPYPSPTSYPGAEPAPSVTAAIEGTETLTPATED